MIYTAASAAGEGREGASMIYTAASAAGEGERGGEYDIHCCIRG